MSVNFVSVMFYRNHISWQPFIECLFVLVPAYSVDTQFYISSGSAILQSNYNG